MIGKNLSNFRITDKLGVGGQGAVYKATDTKLDRTVVIKVIPPELSAKEANLKRFEREAKLASSLDHPNICTIYDLDEVDGVHFIAMQFVEGKNVRQLVAGRPLELGRHIGALVRGLRQMPPAAAVQRLMKHHDLDAQAAENLMRYLADQAAATGSVPDDRTILIERTRDELGDWRVCVLSPRGGRVHAPWAMAAAATIREQTGIDVETLWADDGFVVRFPETDAPPTT